MKISEQAREVALDIMYRPKEYEVRMASERVQKAINDHERDLVEAAEKVTKPASTMTAAEYYEAADALKTALDRRKE